MNGYTFSWGADVSEKGFGYRDALAIVPEDEYTIQNLERIVKDLTMLVLLELAMPLIHL